MCKKYYREAIQIMINIEQYAYDNFIRSGDIAYDIGAHVGSVSNLLISRGASKVLAFEPSPFNFLELKNNTSHANIECYNVAFNDKEYSCTTQFRDCREDRQRDSVQDIQYVLMDKYILSNKLDLPQFVKIDIEGMESLIYKNMEFLFTSTRPVIFTEFHVPEENNTNQDYEHNPHWRSVARGGYDFNELKKHNYSFIDKSLKLFQDTDFTPYVGHFGRIFIPNEKISTYIK